MCRITGNGLYRRTGEFGGYEVDSLIFQQLDKFLIIADIFYPDKATTHEIYLFSQLVDLICPE